MLYITGVCSLNEPVYSNDMTCEPDSTGNEFVCSSDKWRGLCYSESGQ